MVNLNQCPHSTPIHSQWIINFDGNLEHLTVFNNVNDTRYMLVQSKNTTVVCIRTNTKFGRANLVISD